MENQNWVVNSDSTLEEFIRFATDQYEQHGYVTWKWSVAKQRTIRQNNSLHLWLGQVAHMLNECGLDMKKTLKEDYEIPWTMETAKEHLWRPLQKAIIGKEATSEAMSADYNKVYKVLSKHMSEKHGITLPEWPHND